MWVPPDPEDYGSATRGRALAYNHSIIFCCLSIYQQRFSVGTIAQTVLVPERASWYASRVTKDQIELRGLIFTSKNGRGSIKRFEDDVSTSMYCFRYTYTVTVFKHKAIYKALSDIAVCDHDRIRIWSPIKTLKPSIRLYINRVHPAVWHRISSILSMEWPPPPPWTYPC